MKRGEYLVRFVPKDVSCAGSFEERKEIGKQIIALSADEHVEDLGNGCHICSWLDFEATNVVDNGGVYIVKKGKSNEFKKFCKKYGIEFNEVEYDLVEFYKQITDSTKINDKKWSEANQELLVGYFCDLLPTTNAVSWMEQMEWLDSLFERHDMHLPMYLFDKAGRTVMMLLDRLEARAKTSTPPTILGRYWTEGVADGKCAYHVIKESKSTVRVRLVPFFCADGYSVRMIGYEGSVKKSYAEQAIRGEDALAELFGRKKEKKVS